LVTAFELPADADATLPPQVAQATMALWSDPVMATLLERRGEFYVMDNFD